MKFTILTNQLSPVLQSVASVAGSPTGKSDIAENLLLEVRDQQLIVLGTDYSVEMEATLPLTEPCEAGLVAVNAPMVCNIVRSLRPEQNPMVTMTLDAAANSLSIVSGINEFSIAVISPEGFPHFRMDEAKCSLRLAPRTLATLLDKVMFCMPSMGGRELEWSNGVRFDAQGPNLNVYGTNGQILCVCEAPLLGEVEALKATITPKFAQELAKTCAKSAGDDPLSLEFTDSTVTTVCGNYRLSAKLNISAYPTNVKGLVRERFACEIKMRNADLRDAIQTVTAAAGNTLLAVSFLFEEREVTLKSFSNIARGSSKVATDYDGERISVSLNFNYVKEVLSHIHEEEVVFCLTNPVKAAVISGASREAQEGVGYTYCISSLVV
ncbi:MAG: DNA polymerase III subunit beta [Succinivibrionaceae bacterium]|nr:DNA polymerase III subunit beta [Succinivibrionaceae bacterium]